MADTSQSAAEKDDGALAELLKTQAAGDADASAGSIVTAGFENEVPASYRVSIIEIGANIYFDDGSIDTLGPKRVNLQYRDYDLLMTGVTERCCTRIFGALKVQQEGHPPQIVSEMRSSSPGHCTIVERFVLIIKNTRAKNAAGGVEFALEAR